MRLFTFGLVSLFLSSTTSVLGASSPNGSARAGVSRRAAAAGAQGQGRTGRLNVARAVDQHKHARISRRRAMADKNRYKEYRKAEKRLAANIIMSGWIPTGTPSALPSGVISGTPPSGTPPTGTPPSGTPPSGAPPSGTRPSGGAPPSDTPSSAISTAASKRRHIAKREQFVHLNFHVGRTTDSQPFSFKAIACAANATISGTLPSGTPPSVSPPSGAPPSGRRPSGTAASGTPPSGTPPSGTPPVASATAAAERRRSTPQSDRFVRRASNRTMGSNGSWPSSLRPSGSASSGRRFSGSPPSRAQPSGAFKGSGGSQNWTSEVSGSSGPTKTAKSSQAIATTTAAASQATTTTSSSSSSSTNYTGEATWYTQGGEAGACGTVNSDSAKVVALDSSLYGYTGARSSYCGKTVVITNTANGKSVTATVADACPTCSGTYSLDLSESAFEAIGDTATGVLSIEWYFAN